MTSRRRPRVAHALAWVDRAVAAIVNVAAWLALPLAMLLFLQWPLREVIGAYSREANDLAQVLFALYVSVAITAATRSASHLAVDIVARRHPARLRRALMKIAMLGAIVPWSLFVLYAAFPAVMQSLRELERFPDTYNPGYFLLRIALGLLALLALLQAILVVSTDERLP